MPLVKTELLMLIRKGPIWFWLINIGGFIALFFIPMPEAHTIGLTVLWFLQVNRWADIATKEKYFRTDSFSYSAYRPLRRILSAQIIAGFILAVALAMPVILRYLISGDFVNAMSVISGAMLIISFSVFFGIISGGKRLFEIIFFMITYGLLESVPFFDYSGSYHNSIGYILLLMAMILISLTSAFAVRKHEIDHM